MVTDRQVRRLMLLLQTEQSLRVSADKVGMDRETARKYRKIGKLPSALRTDHDWRTRADPFVEVWPWVAGRLSVNPGLEAKTLLEALQRTHPGRFADGQLRTLQRQVKRWRGLEGPGREVFFAQVHHPGRLCRSDFSHMTELGVTIGGRSLEHLVYHFVLTYSNWEAFTICYSESFESLSEGLQNALWELGGVPQRHRTDRLSAAVANTSNLDEFTLRYRSLLEHYGLLAEKTNPDSGNENGDVEQRHHRFKRAVDQALMLRGGRDFADVQAYQQFLKALTEQLNRGRQSRFAEELKVIRGLPPVRLEAVKRLAARVDCGSLIHVDRNAYSVNSRLIGQKVEVRTKKRGHSQFLPLTRSECIVPEIPRVGRAAKGGVVYHALNRGNGRMRLFHKEADYDAFLRLLGQVRQAVPVRLLAWCLMPNHWHLVLWPREDGELLTVCRYVEANALRARLVERAEHWKWGSLWAAPSAPRGELRPDDWPVSRPADWRRRVNAALPAGELEAVRTSVIRGRPFGSNAWVTRTAQRLGLAFTLRPRGRPRKRVDE